MFLMTHLACADKPNDELNKIQLSLFEDAWKKVGKKNVTKCFKFFWSDEFFRLWA